jgi:hypothetical protein
MTSRGLPPVVGGMMRPIDPGSDPLGMKVGHDVDDYG